MMPTIRGAAIAAAAIISTVHALPAGFVDEGFARVPQVTGFNFAPKPGGGYMMLICSKTGLLWVVPDPDHSGERELAMDISDRVCNSGERGLQGVVAHPDFLVNRYIYVYYPWAKNGNCGQSTENGPVNRLARFTMQENNQVDMASELVLFETSPLADDIHNGGDMHFGKDGYLYVTVGDAGNRRDRVSQRRDFLLGSVIRITDNGDIPPGNPYTAFTLQGTTIASLVTGLHADEVAAAPSSSFESLLPTARCYKDGVPPEGFPEGTVCEEIYAYGLRNPFRMAMDPNTPNGVVRAFINDVGGGEWEETNEVIMGANYGWPEREGPCKLDSDTECDEPSAAVFQDPIYWYPHTRNGGAAVGIAFVPNGLWPMEYDDTHIFADFVFNEFYIMEKDPSEGCRECTPPAAPYRKKVFHKVDRPVQLTFGPYQDTQALYYTTRGSGLDNVRRIHFESGGNSAPIAAVEAKPTQVDVGAVVQFSGLGSRDPDADSIDYVWNFGDGSSGVSHAIVVSHKYDLPGEYMASLMVSDQTGFADKVHVKIVVGNPPVPVMESPAEGSTFYVGEVFTLKGSAVDGEGNPVPEEALTWEVRQHHNTHFHPFLDPVSGNNIELQGAPAPEDFEASTNSYLEIILTATDSYGIQGTLSRFVQPETVLLDFDTNPSGLDLILDDFTVRTPVEVVSWVNHKLRVEAPNNEPYVWSRWSNGGEQKHEINVPQVQGSVKPRFVAEYSTDPMVPQEVPAPPTPTTDILFTFPTDAPIVPTIAGDTTHPKVPQEVPAPPTPTTDILFTSPTNAPVDSNIDDFPVEDTISATTLGMTSLAASALSLVAMGAALYVH